MKQKIENLRNKYKGLSFSISNDKFMSKDDYMTSIEKAKCDARIEVLEEVLDLINEHENTNKRVNEGYEIIDSIVLENTEFVFAVNRKSNMYVTWEYYNGSYIWGHYFENEKLAREDFYKRALEEFTIDKL